MPELDQSGAEDETMQEITAAMEVVRLPESIASAARIETIDMSDATSTTLLQSNDSLLVSPSVFETDRESTVDFDCPFDQLGPPSDPLDFPRPEFHRGRRDDVLCYIPANDEHQVMKNVLFRDFSRESPDDAESRVQQAYWPIPHKRPIKTIMGHVEICLVLERCRRRGDEDDSAGEGGTCSSSDDEEEDDIVFQITDRRVAVKVNYSDQMQRLRTRHAEDPLKEIAAMQLIGDSHRNVLGCMEVLFDGHNLNVVMRYCDSGDLFQLLQEGLELDDGAAPGMSEGRARYWFRQLIAGLCHLHSVGVCHRDLSPENVMIDKESGCLIIDLGMCLRVPYIDDQGQITDVQNGARRCLFRPQGACGKLPYMSPEIYRNRDCFDGQAADIFTSGTILFCMVTGNRSYERPHNSDPQFYWMTHGIDQLLVDWSIEISREGVDLLQGMLSIDPRKRLTLAQVANHPWFSFPDDAPSPHG